MFEHGKTHQASPELIQAQAMRNAASRAAWDDAVRRVTLEEAGILDIGAGPSIFPAGISTGLIRGGGIQERATFSNAAFNSVMLAIMAIGVAVIAGAWFMFWQPTHRADASANAVRHTDSRGLRQ